MFKLIVKIIILLSIATLVGAGIFMLMMTNGKKDCIELTNDSNGEKIYLIKTSWGFGDSKMAIGLNKRLRSGFNNTPKDKYTEDVGTEFIFYKFEGGKLLVYNDNFRAPKQNRFRTKILFVGLSNPDFYNLSENKNYLKIGLSVFPKSEIGRLNDVDSLDDNKKKERNNNCP